MSDLRTCITCRVAFRDGEIQRQHYKSDWHRYNLKRKVADLVPVNAEEFNNRVLAQKTQDNGEDDSKYCDSCRKSFSTENAYINHLNSKKHKENEVRKFEINLETRLETKLSPKQGDISKKPTQSEENEMDCDSDVTEELDSDEWDEEVENPVVNNGCLFCPHISRSLERNLRHMSLAHSFFIPDAEFCINVQGLMEYLGEKVYEGFMCLWCNDKGKTFHSADSAQRHMRDKGHCKMLHEGLTLAEYADFYDYSSSYPDNGEDKDLDEEITEPEAIDGSDYQLVLPSGAVIGHRSLMRYYKQSLTNTMAVVPKASHKKLHKVLAHYRALGWTQTQQEQAARKAKDIHYMKRIQAKWSTKLQFKANKLQQHFRPQVNF